jgi:hypothetical protein
MSGRRLVEAGQEGAPLGRQGGAKGVAEGAPKAAPDRHEVDRTLGAESTLRLAREGGPELTLPHRLYAPVFFTLLTR